MAVSVRLFAALRDAAGTSQVHVDSATVAAIVAALSERFGEPFASRVPVASGLLDGQPVRLDDDIVASDGSELALLPPFSGGSTDTPSQRRLVVVLLVGSLLVPALLALGAHSDRWAFGLAVMVISVASLVDLHRAIGAAGVRTVLPGTLVLGIGPGALVLLAPDQAVVWTGGVIALGVIAVFTLTFASPRRHDTADIVGATLLAGLLVAFGAAALLMLYDVVPAERLAGGLALLAVTDTTVTYAGRRTPAPPVGRLAALAVLTAVLAGAAVWAVSGRSDALVPVVGYAVAAVLAVLLTTRLQQSLRRRATPIARPSLLIGTADGVLVAAPLALTWLYLVGR